MTNNNDAPKEWTAVETEYLEKSYKDTCNSEIAREIGKTEKAVKAKAEELRWRGVEETETNNLD